MTGIPLYTGPELELDQVRFEPITHTYWAPNEHQIPNVTSVLDKSSIYGIRDDLSRVPHHILEPRRALGHQVHKTTSLHDTGTLSYGPLGAHLWGAGVTELIQGYTIARTLEATEAELMHAIFPHPTLSEAMHEAVLDAYGRALNL